VVAGGFGTENPSKRAVFGVPERGHGICCTAAATLPTEGDPPMKRLPCIPARAAIVSFLLAIVPACGASTSSSDDGADIGTAVQAASPSVPFNFGGAFGVVNGSPTINWLTCPAGYSVTAVLGTENVDNFVFYCWQPQAGGTPAYDFGGMWGYVNGTAVANDITGDTTCPDGYTSQLVLGTSGVDYPLTVCYRAHVASNDVINFGGMYGYVAGKPAPNPATGAMSCPTGYMTSQVYGTPNVDWQLYYCYQPAALFLAPYVATFGFPLVYGKPYHIRNNTYDGKGNWRWTGGFLDTDGSGCDDRLCVSTATTPRRDGLSGTWVIWSAQGKPAGAPVLGGDLVYLENQWSGTIHGNVWIANGGFLDTDNWAEDVWQNQAELSEYPLLVSTSATYDRDSGSGTWQVLGSADGVPVTELEMVQLLNGYDNFKGGYLGTDGAGCQGNLLCVATRMSQDDASTGWRFEGMCGSAQVQAADGTCTSCPAGLLPAPDRQTCAFCPQIAFFEGTPNSAIIDGKQVPLAYDVQVPAPAVPAGQVAVLQTVAVDGYCCVPDQTNACVLSSPLGDLAALLQRE
jgi:hypothetical protein